MQVKAYIANHSESTSRRFEIQFIAGALLQGSSERRRPRRPGSLKCVFPIFKVVADIRVLVQGIRGWWANFLDTKQDSKDQNKELRIPGRRERRRPAEACFIGRFYI